jgi:Na+/melibiose symporter-like transporter
MKRTSLANLIGMNAYWMGLSFMWNSLHPIILPAVLLHLVPAGAKNSYLGGLTFFDLVLAMFIQPLSGSLSDQWRSRWGKRRPLALLGTGLDLIFLGLLAWSGNIWAVLVGYVGLQAASNLAQGPLQALIPDLVPRARMGTASAVKNLMDMLGLVIASLAAGNLLKPEDHHPIAILLVVMGVLVLSAGITFLTAREVPSEAVEPSLNKRIDLKEMFSFNHLASRNFIHLILSRFVFLLGVYGVQAFAQYYIQDVMRAANPVKATSQLMASLAVTLIVSAMLGGWLTDRFGARRVVALASGISAIGCALLVSAPDMSSLIRFAGVLGAGIGLYLTSNWTLASRLAPRQQAGKYLGMVNLATAGASAASRLLGVPIDILNRARPGLFFGYRGLFILGAAGTLLSLLILAKVKEE